MKRTLLQDFGKYVSLNILGMLGLSLYIFVDTFFVAKVLGANGLAALNFAISIFGAMIGTGLMIGVGGATRFSILKTQKKDKDARAIVFTSIKFGLLLGLSFAIFGFTFSRGFSKLLGADETVLPMTSIYIKTVLAFAPFFIINNIAIVFTRNDNKPNLAMVAMLVGMLANILFDYIFMFVFDMGMFGAALATGFSPVISLIIVASVYVKRSNVKLLLENKMRWVAIPDILSLGLSTFITEFATSIVLITFNLIIFNLEGNDGVAAYGIIANLAVVIMAVYKGLAQGVQPLASQNYGEEKYSNVKRLTQYAVLTSIALSLFIYLLLFVLTTPIINIFNTEQLDIILHLAKPGLRIYFSAIFFLGINILISQLLSATERARNSFIISLARGLIVILPLVLLFSNLWAITGVWVSFVVTEFIVMFLAIYYIRFSPQSPYQFQESM